MAKLTAGQIYSAARQAGFSVASAVVATAVALAESGGDPAAIGDTSLTNATWGPSVGLWQIRTLKSETGTGGTRDISALTGNVAAQAKAALAVSGSGSDWTPWTVYNTGAYQQYLGQAQSASGDPTVETTGWTTPWEVPEKVAGAVRSAVGEVLSDSIKPARKIMLTLLVVGGGLALVGAGLVKLAQPTLNKKAEQAKQVASVII